MIRIVREWVVPGAVGLALGTAIFWLGVALDVPSTWLTSGLVLLTVAGSIALWIDAGGMVIGVLVWLVPTLLVWGTVIAWPTRPGIIALGALAVLPIAAATIEPIRRWFDRLIRRIEGGVTRLALAKRIGRRCAA